MKNIFPWAALAVGALWIFSNTRGPKPEPADFNLAGLAQLPVVADGRIKPLDTVARASLVIIHGKQTLQIGDGHTIDAGRWLADVVFNAPVADGYPSFVIQNPDVLGLFGWVRSDRKFFSYNELLPFLDTIDTQGARVETVPSAQRTPYQTAIHNLRNSLVLYARLKNSLRPEGARNFSAEIADYENELSAAQANGREHLVAAANLNARFTTMAQLASILPVPPETTGANNDAGWSSIGASLAQSFPPAVISPITRSYASVGDAYQDGDPGAFNQHLSELSAWMSENAPAAADRSAFEVVFNRFAPFYQAMGLYVLGFLLVCFSWLAGDRGLRKAALWVILLALAVHTLGLASRMYLQGRPPVTNLYSSAIFIGWATVLIGLVLDRIFRDGVGLACAAAIGFVTLVIAHHLAGSGDTLEMLQAVLDTNIWLATHVVTITIGYSAMFLAGMLAIVCVIRCLVPGSLTKTAARNLSRMAYGVICFATLFSFVGTVLGGIWADQSWGRFWGWDPKENGALLIVLWCAIILHARWGGFIRTRGIMIMALFGNIVTSFSWFGVNMLGVGLHSYGFMNKAVPWLAGFMISQLVLMALALTPMCRWPEWQKAEQNPGTAS